MEVGGVVLGGFEAVTGTQLMHAAPCCSACSSGEWIWIGEPPPPFSLGPHEGLQWRLAAVMTLHPHPSIPFTAPPSSAGAS